MVWALCLNFAFRAGQEHRNLRMKNSQLSVGIDEDGKQYLEYKEDVSKTNSGGLAHAHLKRKIVRGYENNDEHTYLKMPPRGITVMIHWKEHALLDYMTKVFLNS